MFRSKANIPPGSVIARHPSPERDALRFLIASIATHDLNGAQSSQRATRERQPQVVEAVLASHLSPDAADRLEAALVRRLDRMTRAIERLERHGTIGNEARTLLSVSA